MLHEDYDRKCSTEKKKMLVVSLKRFVAKTNCLAVNRQTKKRKVKAIPVTDCGGP
jgi:hypothetical protein